MCVCACACVCVCVRVLISPLRILTVHAKYWRRVSSPILSVYGYESQNLLSICTHADQQQYFLTECQFVKNGQQRKSLTFWQRLIFFTDKKWSTAIQYLMDNDCKAVHVSLLRSSNKLVTCLVSLNQ